MMHFFLLRRIFCTWGQTGPGQAIFLFLFLLLLLLPNPFVLFAMLCYARKGCTPDRITSHRIASHRIASSHFPVPFAVSRSQV
ncbi:hypothetical protein QBC44DRAFT_318621, partial [Cladorrhinum sp. PSN332]